MRVIASLIARRMPVLRAETLCTRRQFHWLGGKESKL